MTVTVEEAKAYLRQCSSDEDQLIEKMIESAEKICLDVARNSEAPEDTPEFTTAVWYTIAYLYEHREEADHHELMLTLRALLSGSREAVF
jgi:uncharacterized phage protein (predicted DNA packaging)